MGAFCNMSGTMKNRIILPRMYTWSNCDTRPSRPVTVMFFREMFKESSAGKQQKLRTWRFVNKQHNTITHLLPKFLGRVGQFWVRLWLHVPKIREGVWRVHRDYWPWLLLMLWGWGKVGLCTVRLVHARQVQFPLSWLVRKFKFGFVGSSTTTCLKPLQPCQHEHGPDLLRCRKRRKTMTILRSK